MNLADGQGIQVTGDFTAGDFVTSRSRFEQRRARQTMTSRSSADEDDYEGLDSRHRSPVGEPAGTPSSPSESAQLTGVS